MKTLTKVLFVAVAAMFISFSAQAQDDNSYTGRATAAVNQCLAQYRAQGFDIVAQEETTGICIAGGFITTVTFYKTVRCVDTPQNPCPRPAAEPVATVTFGCEGEIISADCL